MGIEDYTGQQKKITDGLLEVLPEHVKCPRCNEETMDRYMTKRGIHYKCSNCGFDTNQAFDFYDRDKEVMTCMRTLKKMFPKLNFVINYNYSPEAAITGEFGDRSKNYDISVYWFGKKIARLRVEVNHNITRDRFMTTEECYVVGRPSVVDYMAKKDGIVVHFLTDEKENRIGMSRMKTIKEYCPQGGDRFGNIQYTIPKDLRPLIVTFDIREMEDMLFKGFHRSLYSNLTIE